MALARIALGILFLFLATGILVVSVFRTVSPEYVFSQTNTPKKEATLAAVVKKPVDYYLVYPGILPDHALWPMKALRDRVWLFLTTDHAKKSEILLLLADKRIGAAKALFDGGKVGLAVETAGKGEKYLEEAVGQEGMAQEKGADTEQLLSRLAFSSLKHREILEEMYIKAGDDARPRIVEIMDYAKRSYNEVKMQLVKQGLSIPQSPFEP